MSRYGIAEWYGHDLLDLSPEQRREHADAAVNRRERPCAYRAGACSKIGGVCSMRPYDESDGRIAAAAGATVVMCPSRFEQDRMLIDWLAEIVGFGDDAMTAREVPFMVGSTGKPAGKIEALRLLLGCGGSGVRVDGSRPCWDRCCRTPNPEGLDGGRCYVGAAVAAADQSAGGR